MIGVGVGIAACVAPVYIQELSPAKLRGRMVVTNVVMITLGQVIAYAIDQAFYNVRHGWRWMVGLGAVPAGVQLGFLFFLPESRKHVKERPYRWMSDAGFFPARILVRRERLEEAKHVLGRVYAYATPEQVDIKVTNCCRGSSVIR